MKIGGEYVARAAPIEGVWQMPVRGAGPKSDFPLSHPVIVTWPKSLGGFAERESVPIRRVQLSFFVKILG